MYTCTNFSMLSHTYNPKKFFIVQNFIRTENNKFLFLMCRNRTGCGSGTTVETVNFG